MQQTALAEAEQDAARASGAAVERARAARPALVAVEMRTVRRRRAETDRTATPRDADPNDRRKSPT